MFYEKTCLHVRFILTNFDKCSKVQSVYEHLANTICHVQELFLFGETILVRIKKRPAAKNNARRSA